MMRYKCLIFDHDDTTVNSTTMVHYPCFLDFIRVHRPHLSFTLEEYVRYNFDPGILPFFRDICGFSEEEMEEEQRFWIDYAAHHVSDAFPGIREIMEKQKEAGGILAVVSHSFPQNILNDYAHNALPAPDAVYGWDAPREERKPSPFPVFQIMERFSLQKEDILVIDDLKPGLDMARAAHVDFAAACWCFDIPEHEAYMRRHTENCFTKVEELMRYCFP